MLRAFLFRAPSIRLDQDGEVLDILVQPRRNKWAAKIFFRKLLRGLQYVPRSIVTDKLRSYSAEKAELLPEIAHVREKGANNRAENSHQPTRKRERRMRGFKPAGHAQRFLASFGVIASFFRSGWHALSAGNYREIMCRRFARWGEVVNSGEVFQRLRFSIGIFAPKPRDWKNSEVNLTVPVIPQKIRIDFGDVNVKHAGY